MTQIKRKSEQSDSSALFSNRALKKLLVPLVIEQLLAMTVGMTDTLMVATAGEAAVSGVALVDMVNYLVITVLAAVSTGGAVIVSKYLGSRQKDNAEKSGGQLLMISTLISLGVMTVCLLFRYQLLRLLFGTVEADIMRAAVTYFTITACSLMKMVCTCNGSLKTQKPREARYYRTSRGLLVWRSRRDSNHSERHYT